jgi:RimJ/RimL family protein N-acetyltransferase
VAISELHTKRLLLRAMEPADADGYAELLSDPETHPLITESGPVPRSEIPERIRRNRELSSAGTEVYWSIDLAGVFVGYVALHGANARVSALSYAIRPAWRRRGLAQEALEAICRECRANSRTRELVARTHNKNEASPRLLLQLGFEEVDRVDTPFGQRREFKLIAAQQADEADVE